jgi:hypothetical protein
MLPSTVDDARNVDALLSRRTDGNDSRAELLLGVVGLGLNNVFCGVEGAGPTQ